MGRKRAAALEAQDTDNKIRSKKRQPRRGRSTKKNAVSKSSTIQTVTSRKYELTGLFLFAFGAIALCGLFGLNVGFVGSAFAGFLRYLLGVGSWVAAIFLMMIGFMYMSRHHGLRYSTRFFGIVALYISFLAIYHHFTIPSGAEILPQSLPDAGGLIGGGLLLVLRKLFGIDGGLIVLLAGTIGSILLATTWSLASGLRKTKRTAADGLDAAKESLAFTYEKASELGESAYDAVKEKLDERAKRKEMQASFYNQEKDDRFSDITDQTAVKTNGAAAKSLEVPAGADSPYETIDDDGLWTGSMMDVAKRARSEEKRTTEADDDVVQDATDDLAADHVTADDTTDGSEEDTSYGFSIEYPRNHIEAADEDAGTIDIAHQDMEPDDGPIGTPVHDEQIEGNAEVDEIKGEDTEEHDAVVDQSGTKHLAKAPEANTVFSTPGFDDVSDDYERRQRENQQEAVKKPVVPYVLPKVDDILKYHPKPHNEALEQEISRNAHTLQKTLSDFKVKARIINVCHGPAVTRYEVEPAPGVKVSKITNLADDLALALAAFSVRIEPIPGKAAIGIEVPNKELDGVQLREVLDDENFAKSKSKLTVGLGIDIGGKAIFADLAKMPHLLVAGATGSGKSVCINTLITSILFKAKPDEVKFILIDPKVVELSNYNDIPHMMVPVVTDARKAASVLNWAVQEMEKRYAKFANQGVRDMARYNKAMPDDKMPAIVIIIDELADLMMVAPHDVEDAICRLAQKARAAGIHLVLATQRPSVDVITGIIKANIPSRISFAVSSQIDSRTILDMSGAEKLLGKGDMLFAPIGAPKPLRVQGAFVSDEEVERLIEFIKSQGQETETNEEIIAFAEQEAEQNEEKGKKAQTKQDTLLRDAVKSVLATGQASSSGIQRRFSIGYTRAARLLDTMEELHIVGPPAGSKPREILMNETEAMKAVDTAMA